MRRTKRNALFTFLIAAAILLSLFSAAFAEGYGNLTVIYPFDGTAFRIYLAAVQDENGNYELVGDFAAYDVEIPGESWRDAAATLAGYVALDNIPPLDTQIVTDGQAVFSCLEEALYLVIGEVCTVEGVIYTPVPFLAWVPSPSSVSAVVKYEEEQQAEPVSCSVQKVWAGDDGVDRPQSVTVALLCDGEIYEIVVLSEENGWYYAWEGLDPDCVWQIVEIDVPEGYAVVVTQDGMAFIITNTYQPTTPVPSETPLPTPPPGPSTGDPNNPDFYAGLLIASLVMLVLALLPIRRRKAD